MHQFVIGALAIGLVGCGAESNATDASTADAAPGPPSCTNLITVTEPGPAVVVDTCTGQLVNVATCGGNHAKAVAVRFEVSFHPGAIYYLDSPSSKWISPLSSDCSSVEACSTLGSFTFSGSQNVLVEDPQGGCGTVTLQVNYTSA